MLEYHSAIERTKLCPLWQNGCLVKYDFKRQSIYIFSDMWQLFKNSNIYIFIFIYIYIWMKSIPFWWSLGGCETWVRTHKCFLSAKAMIAPLRLQYQIPWLTCEHQAGATVGWISMSASLQGSCCSPDLDLIFGCFNWMHFLLLVTGMHILFGTGTGRDFLVASLWLVLKSSVIWICFASYISNLT